MKIVNEDKFKNNINAILIKKELKENTNIYTRNIDDFIICEEIDEDINYLFKKKKNFPSNFGKDIEKNINKIFTCNKDPEEEIILLKFEFLCTHIEIIIMEIIYNYYISNFINIKPILDKGTYGGMFEILVIFNIISKKSIGNIKIDDYLSIDCFVPNNYSVKYFSLKRKNNNYKFLDIKNLIHPNKKKISFTNKIILLIQNQFNAKYYDIGVLIKMNNGKYKLILFQITITKDKKKLFSKLENELIFYFVKMNLENNFDIVIESGYFYYILSYKDNHYEDENTLNFCIKNRIGYLGFSVGKNIGFINNINTENEYALITNRFEFHNSCSLVFENCSDMDFITMINNNSFTNIEDEIFDIIQNFFDNKNLQKHYIKKIGTVKKYSNYKYLSNFSFIYIKRKEKYSLILFQKRLFNSFTKIEENGRINDIEACYVYCSLFPLMHY